MTEAKPNCNCEQHAPDGFLTSGFRKAGEKWTCPACGREWAHRCGEANGCDWVQAEHNETLTPAQIQNWRVCLSKIIGPFARNVCRYGGLGIRVRF